jgi:hypothetical protein
VLYIEIQQLYKRKMKIAQIAKHLKVTRGTVYSDGCLCTTQFMSVPSMKQT